LFTYTYATIGGQICVAYTLLNKEIIMDKLAAEKLATEYYGLGCQLALEKIAGINVAPLFRGNALQKGINAGLSLPMSVIGGGLGANAAHMLPPEVLQALTIGGVHLPEAAGGLLGAGALGIGNYKGLNKLDRLLGLQRAGI
jgi:hypothetical protein